MNSKGLATQLLQFRLLDQSSTNLKKNAPKVIPHVKLFQHQHPALLPSFSSPKFPQPIFLPTRKFGPTMRTPEDAEELEGRECPLRPWATLLLLTGLSPSLSLG